MRKPMLCACLALAYIGFIPQTVFKDCVRPVVTKEDADSLSGLLTEEDLIKLYNLSKSDTKIALKTVKMIDENKEKW